MPVIDQQITEDYAIYHADCMEVLKEIGDNSVDLAIYSPPFPELYQYSDDVRDVTNCVSYQESLDQLSFIVREMSRVTKPGRLNCVHCTDLKRGQIYQHDFPGDLIRMHEETDLQFFCRVTIWKDAWEFARRTRMTTLMHRTLCEDSSKSRVAPADYLLMFKKRGENMVPIEHKKGFKHYIGSTTPPEDLVRDFGQYRGDPRGNSMSHWIYRQYASPVWMDVRRGRILPYRAARENEEERHVCPLQLDVIDRCVAMWSNPGETILTPFMGVGSEVFGAVSACRKAIGIELKGTYYRQAKANAAAGVTAQSAEAPLFNNSEPEPVEATAEET